jgi:methyl-accepting chemotaxis protein
MSTDPTPPKQDLAKEIWRIATSLSDEMQNAAIRKARELGFALTKGRIPLDETLINLTQIRDLLIDAVQTNKLVQLPIKVQIALLSHTQRVADSLTALVNGTDAIAALDDSVEDLMEAVWHYNLHNLSEQVLGYHTKMNQLKVQDVLIAKAYRQAQDFQSSSERAAELLRQTEEFRRGAEEQVKTIQSTAEQSATSTSRVVEAAQFLRLQRRPPPTLRPWSPKRVASKRRSTPGAPRSST